jgi:hypothetical protein
MPKELAKPYRPETAKELELFILKWCPDCARSMLCDINEDGWAVMHPMLDTENSDFPPEWQYDKTGKPICTAFERDTE